MNQPASSSEHSGSIAQMGNCSTRSRTQFDFPATRLEHGGPISIDGGEDGRCSECDRMEVAPTHDARLLRGGVDPGQLRPPGLRGDPPEEHLVGEKEVPDRGRPGTHEVPPPGKSDSKGKSVCFMDGVPEVRSEADVHPSSGTTPRQSQGQEQPSPGILKRSSVFGGKLSFYGDTKYKTYNHLATSGAHPRGAERHPEGYGLQLSRSGTNSEGVSSRPRTDVGDDAATGRSGGDSRDDAAAGFRRGDEERRPGDGERRLAGQLGSNSKSQPHRPAVRTWPRSLALPAISMSSSLLSWGQLTDSAKGTVTALGGGADSWIVHCPLPEPTQRPRLETLTTPSWTQWPWVSATTSIAPSDKEEVLWHEVRERDLLQARGPGPVGSLEKDEDVMLWTCPTKFRMIHEALEPWAVCQGIDERGNPSREGPYWLVDAPRIQRALEEEYETISCPEVKSAEESLWRMAREQRRGLSNSEVDLVELFHAGAITQCALREGIRVPASHESFTTQSGWTVQEKSHRQRFRKFLRDRRPELVVMNLPKDSGCSASTTRSEATTSTDSSSTTRSPSASRSRRPTTRSGATTTTDSSSTTRSPSTSRSTRPTARSGATTSTDTSSTTWSSSGTGDRSQDEVVRSLRTSFSLEVINEQVRGGRLFYLEADQDDQLWRSTEWREVITNPAVLVQTDKSRGRRIATSSAWMWSLTKAKTGCAGPWIGQRRREARLSPARQRRFLHRGMPEVAQGDSVAGTEKKEEINPGSGHVPSTRAV